MRVWCWFALLLFVTAACSAVSLRAQDQADSWKGEWGSFQRVASSDRDAYEGNGLAISQCAPTGTSANCAIALQVTSAQGNGDAKGVLEINSATQAIAHLSFEGKEYCSVRLTRPEDNLQTIQVSAGTGSCSEFLTLKASFLHEYPRRTTDLYFADNIPACFAAFDPARTALCTDKQLSGEEHAWTILFLQTADLTGVQQSYKASGPAESKLVAPCEAAASPASCLHTNFTAAMAQLSAQRAAWFGAVSEAGNPVEAAQKLDAIAGSYRRSFENGDLQGDNFLSTDTLRITRLPRNQLKYDVHLEFYNGHECNCVFELIPTAEGVKLSDPTGACREQDCGMRGGYNGAAFTSQQKQ